MTRAAVGRHENDPATIRVAGLLKNLRVRFAEAGARRG
jgi:hypothetical protein